MNELPLDLLGRALRDVRISVTDRCNFRCTYCMPRAVFGAEYPFLPRAGVLSFEEITRLVRAFAALGVRKVRLTGGEPLLRRELPSLVAQIAAVPGIQDLALTTNGSLLAEQAAALFGAGLARLTVSLDALDPAIFAALADTQVPVARVLAGLEAAEAAGFRGLKINTVVKRGANEAEIPALVRRFGQAPYILRFIEYMDVGNSNRWRQEQVVPAAEILARVQEVAATTPLPANYPGETARRYALKGGGEIGIISSISQPFCRQCTRARLSAEGRLYTCLFAQEGLDLRTPLRAGVDDAGLQTLIRTAWQRRDDRYSELRAQPGGSERRKPEMSLLGG